MLGVDFARKFSMPSQAGYHMDMLNIAHKNVSLRLEKKEK